MTESPVTAGEASTVALEREGAAAAEATGAGAAEATAVAEGQAGAAEGVGGSIESEHNHSDTPLSAVLLRGRRKPVAKPRRVTLRISSDPRGQYPAARRDGIPYPKRLELEEMWMEAKRKGKHRYALRVEEENEFGDALDEVLEEAARSRAEANGDADADADGDDDGGGSGGDGDVNYRHHYGASCGKDDVWASLEQDEDFDYGDNDNINDSDGDYLDEESEGDDGGSIIARTKRRNINLESLSSTTSSLTLSYSQSTSITPSSTVVATSASVVAPASNVFDVCHQDGRSWSDSDGGDEQHLQQRRIAQQHQHQHQQQRRQQEQQEQSLHARHEGGDRTVSSAISPTHRTIAVCTAPVAAAIDNEMIMNDNIPDRNANMSPIPHTQLHNNISSNSSGNNSSSSQSSSSNDVAALRTPYRSGTPRRRHPTVQAGLDGTQRTPQSMRKLLPALELVGTTVKIENHSNDESVPKDSGQSDNMMSSTSLSSTSSPPSSSSSPTPSRLVLKSPLKKVHLTSTPSSLYSSSLPSSSSSTASPSHSVKRKLDQLQASGPLSVTMPLPVQSAFNSQSSLQQEEKQCKSEKNGHTAQLLPSSPSQVLSSLSSPSHQHAHLHLALSSKTPQSHRVSNMSVSPLRPLKPTSHSPSPSPLSPFSSSLSSSSSASATATTAASLSFSSSLSRVLDRLPFTFVLGPPAIAANAAMRLYNIAFDTYQNVISIYTNAVKASTDANNASSPPFPSPTATAATAATAAAAVAVAAAAAAATTTAAATVADLASDPAPLTPVQLAFFRSLQPTAQGEEQAVWLCRPRPQVELADAEAVAITMVHCMKYALANDPDLVTTRNPSFTIASFLAATRHLLMLAQATLVYVQYLRLNEEDAQREIRLRKAWETNRNALEAKLETMQDSLHDAVRAKETADDLFYEANRKIHKLEADLEALQSRITRAEKDKMVERGRREQLCSMIEAAEARAVAAEAKVTDEIERGKKNEQELLRLEADHDAIGKLDNHELDLLEAKLVRSLSVVNEARRSRSECIVCMDSHHLVVAVPCRHQVLCIECITKLHPRVCPLCKKTIADIVVPLRA